MKHSEDMRSMSNDAGVCRHRWVPDSDSKGVIVLVHGIAEHSGRYHGVAETLTGAGYTVVGFDLRGFGRSDGPRGHLRFARAFEDIDEIVGEERRSANGRPLFLLGHSVGGTMVLLYALDRQPQIAGVVAIAPALHTAVRDQPAKVFLARLLGTVLPGMTMATGLDDTKLTRDPDALQDFRSDPLVHHRMSMGFALDAMAGMDRTLENAGQFRLPLLLIHSRADEVNFLSGSQEFAARHPGDCTLSVYEGARHDVKSEPEWDAIGADIVRWLDDHLPPAG